MFKEVFVVKKVLLLSIVTVLLISIAAMANVVTITLYGAEHLQVAVNLYEETHPNVKINLVDLPYSDYIQKIGLAMVEGKQYFPNIFELTTAYMPMVKPYLINLAPYIQSELNMTPQQYKDSIYPSMSVFMGEGDQILAVPLAMSSACMWINKPMWEKAGILPPPLNGQTTPWTWDQFIDAVKKVKTANNLSYGMSLQKSADRFYQFISEYGVTELNSDGQFVLDQYPQAPSLIDQFLSLFKDKIIPSGEWLATENPDQDFLGGVTAAYWAGTWVTYEATSETNKFVPVYMPAGSQWFGLPGGDFLAVFNTGNKEKDQTAIDFATWMANKNGEGYQQYVEQSYTLSAYKGQIVDYGIPAVNDWESTVFIPLVSRAPAWAMTDRSSLLYSRIYDPIVKQLQLGIMGQVNGQQIVQNLKKDYESLK